MNYFLIVPFLLGSLVVFQPALNHLLLEQKGLSYAVGLNGAVVFLLAFLFLLAVINFSEKAPEFVRPRWGGVLHYWYFLPGVMGFALVLLVPLSIKYFGAMSTVIALLLGQLATSFLWDLCVDPSLLHSGRIVGLGLAALGAYLSFRPML